MRLNGVGVLPKADILHPDLITIRKRHYQPQVTRKILGTTKTDQRIKRTDRVVPTLLRMKTVPIEENGKKNRNVWIANGMDWMKVTTNHIIHFLE